LLCFHCSFETEDGIKFRELTTVENRQNDKNANYASDQSSIVKQGEYSYTSPKGIPIHVTYIADSNGFHPTGELMNLRN